MSNHPASRGDYGIIGPLILIAFAVALVGFWPVMVVHGYTDTGGWRWDIHSTIAELAYLGTIGFIITLAWLGNRPARLPRMPARTPLEPGESEAFAAAFRQAPPVCLHPGAVKVDSAYYRNFGRTVIFCCWCPDCEAELPAAFRLACCGTEPGDGTVPARHAYNCPHRTGGTR